MRTTPLPLLLLLALLLPACPTVDDGDVAAPGDGPTATEPTPATAPEDRPGTAGPLSIPQIVRTVAPSTVSIVVEAERNGQVARGEGSGVIWSPDGVIVTNAHVVAPAQQIQVALADGRRFDADVIATDPRTDLAALRIDATGLPAATFVEQLPVVGELAVAIGNPLGFENTATAGIVSGIDRALPVEQGGPALVGLLQTDASISSGNSGGALVNGEAEVIGINVAAVGNQVRGVAENVGFAIPATTVSYVVTQLVERGQVAHPFLGISGATVTPQIAERFGLPVDHGVIVRQLPVDSPAAAAGVEQGDVITALDGKEVRSLGELLGTIRRYRPGDQVTVTVQRGTEERTFDVTFGELPSGS